MQKINNGERKQKNQTNKNQTKKPKQQNNQPTPPPKNNTTKQHHKWSMKFEEFVRKVFIKVEQNFSVAYNITGTSWEMESFWWWYGQTWTPWNLLSSPKVAGSGQWHFRYRFFKETALLLAELKTSWLNTFLSPCAETINMRHLHTSLKLLEKGAPYNLLDCRTTVLHLVLR